MTDKSHKESEPTVTPAEPKHRVRLPGFLIEEDVGLGDVIKQATSYIGVRPCGGCQRRASALNRWMTFTRRDRS